MSHPSRLLSVCAGVQSVRRELAHYMKAELGMKGIKIPEKEKTSGSKRKSRGNDSAKKTRTEGGQKGKEGSATATAAKASTASPLPPATPFSETLKGSTHKVRQREKKSKQRQPLPAATPDAAPPAVAGDAVAADTPAPPSSTASAPTARASGQKKNAKRRAKEKEQRKAKAQLKRTAPELFPTPAPASATAAPLKIDPSIKNSTRPLVTPAHAPPPLSEHAVRLAAQAASEANNARFATLAAQFEQGKWYTHTHATYTPQPSSRTIVLDAASQARLAALRAKAHTLLTAYAQSVSHGGGGLDREDQRWLSQIMGSGTLSDKVAGMALLLQDRCVGRLDLLERLLAMAQKKGRRESLMAIDALKDVFINELVPTHRPLVFFTHQAALHGQSSDAAAVDDTTLMYWLFEDAVKVGYARFLTVLESHLHDPMTYIKKHAINAAFSLLTSLPEREKALLTLVVNKLGDPDRKVASRIVFLLSELIHLHRGMRISVVKEVEAFLYRPNVSERGQYYAVIFLNQIRLVSGQDAALAQRMVGVYFAVFAQEVRRADAVNSKLLAGLLSGINRALPFAKEKGEVALKDSQVDLLFSLTHQAAFHTAVQALMLLWQVVSEDTMSTLASRYYRALYELMTQEEVGVGVKVSLLLNLLYRSMKGDESEARVAAFVKRLLQVAMGRSAGFLCGCLYLVSEVSKKHGSLHALMSKGDWKAEDDEEEHFTDARDDDDHASHSASKAAPHRQEKVEEEKESDEEEDGEEDGVKASAASTSRTNGSAPHPSSSSPKLRAGPSHGYDPSKREPLYAQANLSALWELTALLQHYHPSVQSWTRRLLSSQSISYDGDPLVDFTLTSFLDRFVFRNPKKITTPAPSLIAHSHLQKGGGRLPPTATQLPVSSRDFLQKRPEEVREDEAFFHRYFVEKERREVEGLGRKKKKKAKAEGGEERADDEEAIDAFADRVMEEELLKAQDPDMDDEDDLLQALEEDDEEEGQEEEEGEGEEEEGEDEAMDAAVMADMDGLDEEEEDDEEAEAEAALAMDGDEDDIDMPTFSDEEEDEGDEEDAGEGEVQSRREKKRRRVDGVQAGAAGLGSESVFASAEEFADLLTEGVEGDAVSEKEREREFTHDRQPAARRGGSRGRRGRGGGRGGAGGSGRGRKRGRR